MGFSIRKTTAVDEYRRGQYLACFIWRMLPSWRKRVLQEGRGLYRPSELATVKVDVVGRYGTTNGCSGDVFDRREEVSMKIGNEGALTSIDYFALKSQS